jgi:hypothetical protein
VTDKNYFTRQAITLLRFAQSTSDPHVAAALVDKASDLSSKASEAPLAPDLGPRAPDVEPGGLI